MGGFSLWHWIVVLIIVLLLFGRGRVSEIMGDFGKGLKSFKQGMAEDDKPAAPPAQIPAQSADQATIDADSKVESPSKPQ
jgi:sec-independent protein translocase protein TatA